MLEPGEDDEIQTKDPMEFIQITFINQLNDLATQFDTEGINEIKGIELLLKDDANLSEEDLLRKSEVERIYQEKLERLNPQVKSAMDDLLEGVIVATVLNPNNDPLKKIGSIRDVDTSDLPDFDEAEEEEMELAEQAEKNKSSDFGETELNSLEMEKLEMQPLDADETKLVEQMEDAENIYEYFVETEEAEDPPSIETFYPELEDEHRRFHLGLPHRHTMPLASILKNAWIMDEKIVTNITAQGRVRTVSTLLIIGSGEGLASIGFGKGVDGSIATLKAARDALKNLRPFNRYEGRTIPYKIEYEWRCSKIVLTPRPEGYGLTGNKPLRSFAEAIGYQDMSIKTYGSRNIYNLLICMWKALSGIMDPKEHARARGKIFIDGNERTRTVIPDITVGQHNFKEMVERLRKNPDRWVNNDVFTKNKKNQKI